MITTAIVYDHRGRTAKNRPGPLEVRVTNERKVHYVNTGVKVLRSEWKHGMVIDHPNADELNERLVSIEKAVEREVNNRLARQLPIDVAEIKRAVWGVRENGVAQQTTFLDWYERTYPTLNLSAGTRRRYKSVLARLRACALINRYEDLTVENIYRWDDWLHQTVKARSGNGNGCDGAIFNHHKVLKAMIARAVLSGMVINNPYDRLRGQFKRGDVETVPFLTEPEVDAFLAVEPVGSMMRAAKDIFIFQLYTGMSYSDAQQFDIHDYKEVDGRFIHVGARVKTGVPYVSQLLPPTLDVLKRNGMKVPSLSNQKYNMCLKILGSDAGIRVPLHSHIARHTFATWMLKNGVKIENVSRMLGHTNITQTQRYAKVLAESVHDDFDRMEKLLTNKKNDEKTTTNDSGIPDADCL